jgi:hypothetical protein
MSEQNNSPLNALKQQLTEYIDLKVELLKLEFYEKASLLSASLASGLIVILLITFFVLSLFLSFAFYLGQLLHNYALGFGLSGLLYLVLLILFFVAFKSSFKKYITNKLIQLFAAESNEEE